jgi:phosphoribosyl-AMP cyclohydrolase
MNNEKTIKAVLAALAGVVLLTLLIAPFVSFYNNEATLRNQFVQKTTERSAFYQKMYTSISQQTQIAVKNDASFKEVVNAQIQGQKTAENTMMVWIKQSNPAATFTEVTKLYASLSRAIESERAGFFEQEKMMQDIKLQHDNLLNTTPGSIINVFFSRQHFDYKPISSDYTDAVFKTGKETVELNLN